MLAFAYGYLGEHDLLCERTDIEKYLPMAALNVVECVAIRWIHKYIVMIPETSPDQDGTAGRSPYSRFKRLTT